MFKQCKKDCVYYFYVLYSEDNLEEIRYVGVTTRTIRERFYEHKSCANNKASLPVHKWMYSKHKDGIQIIYKEIDYCSYIEWQTRERYWIKYYKDLGHKLLNLQKGGSSIVTKEMQNFVGFQRSGFAKQKCVAAYTLNGELYKQFNSIKEAAEYFHCKSPSTITWGLKGMTACGHKWKLISSYYKPEVKETNSEYNKALSFNQFDLNGNLIKNFKSLREMFRFFELNSSVDYFHKNILNKNIIWKNSLWSTEDTLIIEPTKIYKYIIYNVDGTIFKGFKSRKFILEYLNWSADKLAYTIKQHKIFNNKYIIKH